MLLHKMKILDNAQICYITSKITGKAATNFSLKQQLERHFDVAYQKCEQSVVAPCHEFSFQAAPSAGGAEHCPFRHGNIRRLEIFGSVIRKEIDKCHRAF